jgi:hypothetical protein
MMVAAGMEKWLAGVYLLLVVLVSLVYGRVRAEVGIPLIQALPWGQQDVFLFNLLGQAPLIGPGPDLRSPTALALFKFLNTGRYSSISGYDVEGIALGHRTGMNWSRVTVAIVLAMVAGALLGFGFHLVSYYDVGASGTAQGTFQLGHSMTHWALWDVVHGSELPQRPVVSKALGAAWGAVVVGVLTLVRSRWMNFPLHPLGYALTVGYNDPWFNFFLVWVIKVTVLRYGGGRSYMRLLPLFLGLALGHLISAGLVMSTLASLLGGPFARIGILLG